MSMQSALQFIQHSGKDEIKEKLQGISSSDKEAALKAVVEVGKGAGFDFTAEEYEEVAREVATVLNGENKGIEALQTTAPSAANCSCTGCAACAACTGCVVCVSCSWCVVIPIGGEAVIAADAAAVISAATSIATSVSTAVASSVQGG